MYIVSASLLSYVLHNLDNFSGFFKANFVL
jgi:hypothetical protein